MNPLDNVFNQLRFLRSLRLTMSEAWEVIRACGASYVPEVYSWVNAALVECGNDYDLLHRLLPHPLQFVRLSAHEFRLVMLDFDITPPAVSCPREFFAFVKAAGALNGAFARIDGEGVRPSFHIVTSVRSPYGDLAATGS